MGCIEGLTLACGRHKLEDMKSSTMAFLFFVSLGIGAGPLRAEFYQWVDSRGIIHFTDSYDRVPDELRGSSRLIVRTDLLTRVSGNAAASDVKIVDDPEEQAQKGGPGETVPPEETAPEGSPVSIHHNPQQFNIIVVRPVVVRRPKIFPGPPPKIPKIEPLKLSVDRRYIHPSVFSGGSREFIHPSTFDFVSKFPIRPQESRVKNKEGQITKISGTDLTIKVRGVVDYTSRGCLGGAVGCPDHVQLQVALGKESKDITLYFAHTGVQREQGINRADIFGHSITLVALQGKEVTLSIEKSN